MTDAEEKLLSVHPVMFRAHPFKFGFAIAFMIFCAIVALGIIHFRVPAEARTVMRVAALALLVVEGLSLGAWRLKCLCTTLTVTPSRTILRRGILARRTVEVRHQDVRSIQVHQGILQRLFFTGDIAVGTAAQSGLEIVAGGVPNPQRVADLIRQGQAE